MIDDLVTEHNKLDFQAAAELAFQQTASYLVDHVSDKDCEGEASVGVKIFDTSKGKKRTGRLPKNFDNRTPRRKRWLIYQDPYEDGEYVEDTDMMKQAMDPQSDLMMAKMASVHRWRDENIIQDGMFGDAWEGKSGPSSKKLFPATNVVDVGTKDEDDTVVADKGQNIKKMRQARLQLAQSEVFKMYPGDMPCYGWNAKQHDDMLQYLKVTSLDFNRQEEPVLVSGRVSKFMGFKIVECERWPLKDGTTDVRLNAAWVPRAIKLGKWRSMRARIWNDPHLNQAVYINVDVVEDARRMHDEGVIQIENKE